MRTSSRREGLPLSAYNVPPLTSDLGKGDLYTIWVGIAGIVVAILIGWLTLKTDLRGVQVLKSVSFEDAMDPVSKDTTYSSFRGATMDIEVHNAGNVGFALSDVRLFVKESKLTTQHRHIAAKNENCRSNTSSDIVDYLFDVKYEPAPFGSVSIHKGEVTPLMISFYKSKRLPCVSRIKAVLTPERAGTAVEGLLCANFIYSSYDKRERSVLQPLFLGRFIYDNTADALWYEMGPPFIITRQTQDIF
jgi:hypothetical protein